MRPCLFAAATILLASTAACTGQGYDGYPGPSGNPGYERRYDERRDDGRRYEERRYEGQRGEERRYDQRRDGRGNEDQRFAPNQDLARRQQQYNQNLASLQQQHNQGVVALQQQFNQGRINRAQLDAGYRDLETNLNRRTAEEKRAAGGR